MERMEPSPGGGVLCGAAKRRMQLAIELLFNLRFPDIGCVPTVQYLSVATLRNSSGVLVPKPKNSR